MDIVNCPRCGKLFTKFADPLCDDCKKAEEELFKTVRDYVETHRECTVPEVTRETGATVKKIMKYLREGRLEVSSGMKDVLKCEKCGVPITSGRFCNSCVIDINQEVDDLYADRRIKHDNRRDTQSIWSSKK